MQILHLHGDAVQALPATLDDLPASLPEQGFVWVAIHRDDAQDLGLAHSLIAQWDVMPLLDLHWSDLRNEQLRSQYDDTSGYEVLVFRRLDLQKSSGPIASPPNEDQMQLPAQFIDAVSGADTSPIGFAVWDRMLLSVHPPNCPWIDGFARRLIDQSLASEARGSMRLPTQPSDLMLRMVNQLVDAYLNLRRHLSATVGQLEQQLFDPRSQFRDWPLLLSARRTLHLLEDTCEDQRSAITEWLDAFEEWPLDSTSGKERDLLRVRAKDVVEHVDRVLTHIRRLQSALESAVQIHLSAVSNRTNDIMRTLTVLTAIFLPLNLLTGFFGMNFQALPLIHSASGFWVVLFLMIAVGGGLGLFFWRKRLLGSSSSLRR